MSLNKNPRVDFDLRYLVGDYQTQADLALNARHLSNLSLWSGQATASEFLPWYWPALQDVAAQRRRQIQLVVEHLDDSIVMTLGFPKSDVKQLSRHARGALSLEESPGRVTFRKFFVSSCRSLPILLDRRRLGTAAAREDGPAREAVSRVVAAEFGKWIRRDLLGPQDVVVDLPHLLMRMPLLLGEGAEDLDRWNEAVGSTEPPYGLSPEIYDDHLKAARCSPEFWPRRPCFWWRTLRTDEGLNRKFFDDRSSWAPAVFCEDISQFRLLDTRNGPEGFTTEFEGAWARRHVAHLEGKHYTPMSRFAK